ncbi:MAG: tryptophan--tRNA ligase [Alphaproteobacteria bacterium]|nr:tryptophan--tRNA ligase [Alphaproteobacteria bacterium]MDD9920566.1 tryptophan--tRNA ligase [Alphaproteobacteria bacterium]
MSRPTIISGIQSSGQPSLGNLLGAFLQFIKYQETHETFCFVADHHAITVRQDPKKLHENSYAIAAWYIACGLDPAKCTIFLQSHVRAHAELGWILGTFTQMGELERMTQFKDKSQRHAQNINAGLFTYPALMAADILLYQVDEVPVGDDQRQHLELTRTVATRFNNVYGDTFKLPQGTFPKNVARVKDLQEPTKKMSKSSDSLGTVFLLDDLKTIEKKFKKAVTDNVGAVNLDEENQPGVANLLAIYAACAGVSLEDAAAQFEGSQYGPFKAAVAEAVCGTIDPIQKRYYELMDDKTELDRIFAQGAAKASAVADKTLQDVMDKVGYVRPVSL